MRLCEMKRRRCRWTMLNRLVSSSKTIFFITVSVMLVVAVYLVGRLETGNPSTVFQVKENSQSGIFEDKSSVENSALGWNRAVKSSDLKTNDEHHDNEAEKEKGWRREKEKKGKFGNFDDMESAINRSFVHVELTSSVPQNKENSASAANLSAQHTIKTTAIPNEGNEEKPNQIPEISTTMKLVTASTRATTVKPYVRKEIILFPPKRTNNEVQQKTIISMQGSESVTPTTILQHYLLHPDTVVNFAVYDTRYSKMVRIFAAQPHDALPLEYSFQETNLGPGKLAKRELVSRSDTFETHYDVLNYYHFECLLPVNLKQPPSHIYIRKEGSHEWS
ncbi:uncharacterized protein LOC106180893, partial [Lingula anatina]|uniref:Uncharacterized protein LOC106180893 n=1 Tax=Lingula anatina TaxID=7574 RepID=A0A1S3KE45_LINAN